MNQSITCGPMPLPLPTHNATAASGTRLPRSKICSTESEASLSEVRDSEIEDHARPEKEQPQREAWTVYGIASIAAELPPVAVVLSISTTEGIEGVSQRPDESTVQDQAELL